MNISPQSRLSPTGQMQEGNKQITDVYNLILSENIIVKQKYNEILDKYNILVNENTNLTSLLNSNSNPNGDNTDNNMVSYLQNKNAELMNHIIDKNKEINELKLMKPKPTYPNPQPMNAPVHITKLVDHPMPPYPPMPYPPMPKKKGLNDNEQEHEGKDKIFDYPYTYPYPSYPYPSYPYPSYPSYPYPSYPYPFC